MISHSLSATCTLVLALVAMVDCQADPMPPPFYRVLYYTVPMMEGKDVYIMQNLLLRSPYVSPSLQTDGIYGHESQDAVSKFQVCHIC